MAWKWTQQSTGSFLKGCVKKTFLDGLRGKAAWRLNRAILVGVLIMFAYLRVGRLDWTSRLAANVPLGWKYVALILMLAISAYTCRQIYCGIVDRTLPRMNPGWLVIEVVALFIFAGISADKQTLFNLGTLLWVAILFGTARFYSRKPRRGQREDIS